MLRYLLVLMAFQFSGEGIKAACGVTFPGPLIGMILMLTWLFLRGGVPEDLNVVSSALVNHLGLFFVPAGAGIIAFGSLLASDGVAIISSLVLSSAFAIVAGGIVAKSLSQGWTRRGKAHKVQRARAHA
ncbi:MAG: CidA/LrgA family protein [Rhodomicrobium sp.]